MAKAKAKEKECIKNGTSRFRLVGLAKVTDFTFSLDNENSKGDYIYSRMNLGIDCGNNNIVYSEMMGGYKKDGSSEIYVHGKKDGKDNYEDRLVYGWEDRNDPSIFPEIGDACFKKVGLEHDVKGKIVERKFLSEYDMIEYVNEHIEDGMVVSVSGTLEYSVYQGETQVKKKVNSIFLSKAKPEEFEATFTQTFLLEHGYSFSGKPDLEKNIFTVYGYVPQYVGKIDGNDVKKTLLIPKTFDFDLTKHSQAVIAQLIKNFINLKQGYLFEIVIDGLFKEGMTTVQTTFEDLEPEIRLLVEIGAMTKEMALTKTAITGTRDKRMIFSTLNILKVTTKNEDGTESVTNTINTNAEKYKVESADFYKDYEVAEEIVGTDDISSSGTILDDTSLDFLNGLV